MLCWLRAVIAVCCAGWLRAALAARRDCCALRLLRSVLAVRCAGCVIRLYIYTVHAVYFVSIYTVYNSSLYAVLLYASSIYILCAEKVVSALESGRNFTRVRSLCRFPARFRQKLYSSVK